MKKLFKKSKPKEELISTQEDLLSLVEKGDFQKFREILARESWMELEQRAGSYRKYMEELRKHPPALENQQERMKRNAKLMEAQKILTELKETKKRTAREEHFQQNRAWQKQAVPQNLSLLRYVVGNAATMLKNGVVSPDTLGNQWMTPTSTIIPIVTTDGRKISFDLINDIHPSDMRNILENALTLYIFEVRSAPAYRNGNPVGMWREGNQSFEQEQKIKPVFHPSYIAVRKV